MRHAVLLFCVAIIPLAFLSGCRSNAFTEYYQPNKSAPDPTIFEPHSARAEIYTTNNPQADARNLAEKGYVFVGVSSFEGTINVTNNMILDQAEKVRADVVLYRSNFLRSEQGVQAIPQYNPGQVITTNSSGTVNASANGSGGYAYGTGSYYGTATTTTPGTFSTQYVPTTLNRYSHEAGFFRKAKMGILGVQFANLPEDIRRSLERNTGVQIGLIVIDGPAYRANMFSGDIIIRIAGEDVLSVTDFPEKLRKYANTKVTMTIIRAGKEREIEVQLNPPRETPKKSSD